MAITPTLSVFLNYNNPSQPVLISTASTVPARGIQVVGGEKVTLKVYLVNAVGASPTYVLPAAGDTIRFTAKKQAGDEDLIYLFDEWTIGADHVSCTADFATVEGFWETATDVAKSLISNFEVETEAGLTRKWSFFTQVVRQSYGGEEPPVNPGETYVKYTAQTPTTEQQTQALTNLGGTTVGRSVFRLTNPSAVTWIRVNADNTVTARTAAETRSDIGAGTGSGDILNSGTITLANAGKVAVITALNTIGAGVAYTDAASASSLVQRDESGGVNVVISNATGGGVFGVHGSTVSSIIGPNSGAGVIQSWKNSAGATVAYANSAGGFVFATDKVVINDDGDVEATGAVSGGSGTFGTLTVSSVATFNAPVTINEDLTVTGELGGNTSNMSTSQTAPLTVTSTLKATTSAGCVIQSSNGTTCASWGAGGGANFTVAALAITAGTITANAVSYTFPGTTGTLALNTAATTSAAGLVELATPAEDRASVSSSVVSTPEGLRANRLSSAYRMSWSSASWISVVSGAGASTASTEWGQEIIGPTTAAGHALRYLTPSNQAPICRGVNRGVIDWSKRVEFAGVFILSNTPDANTVVRLTWGKTTADAAGDLARAGIGFKITGSGVLQAHAHNGTTATTGTNGTFTPTASQGFDYLIALSGGTVTITVNDTVVASCTGGPTAAGGQAAALIQAEAQNTSTVSTQTSIGHSLSATFIART